MKPRNKIIPISMPKKLINIGPIVIDEMKITRKNIKNIAKNYNLKYKWWCSKKYNRNFIISILMPPPPKFNKKFFKRDI